MRKIVYLFPPYSCSCTSAECARDEVIFLTDNISPDNVFEGIISNRPIENLLVFIKMDFDFSKTIGPSLHDLP